MFKRLIFIVIIICFFSCSKQDNLEYNINLNQVTEINKVMEKENPDLFRFIAAFTVDHEENIYIVDNISNDNRLIKIDKTGKLKWVLNTIGQGPGEFLRITDVCCFKDRILVCDQNRRKILIFSNKGLFIDEFKVINGMPTDIEVDNDGFIYISLFYLSKGFLLHKYSQEGEFLDSIIKKKYNEKINFFDSCINGFSFCIDRNNNILLAFRYFYSIYKYATNGRLLKKWSRKLPYKPQNPRLVQPAPNQMEVKGDIAIEDIAVDSHDRIFVLWGCKGNDNGMQVDLFSAEGVLLSEFRTGIKPYYDSQLIYMGVKDDFYVANRIEEANIYKFIISISKQKMLE